MLLLFASCLDYYVHGAFLLCGESCLKFQDKYKAVSSQIGKDIVTLEVPEIKGGAVDLALQKVLPEGNICSGKICTSGKVPLPSIKDDMSSEFSNVQ